MRSSTSLRVLNRNTLTPSAAAASAWILPAPKGAGGYQGCVVGYEARYSITRGGPHQPQLSRASDRMWQWSFGSVILPTRGCVLVKQ